MPKELADHCEALPEGQGTGREGMAAVMNPDVSEFRPLVHEAPLAVNEAQALALLPSLDHLGVALSPRTPPSTLPA